MAVRRIGILLPMLGISGGINIVLNWAVILAKAGYHLDIILPRSATRSRVPFLAEQDSRLLHLISETEARQYRYHSVIATWWAGIAFLAELKSDHHAWFMQAFEGQFFPVNIPEQGEFDEMVASQMNVITTAHWLQQHILRHYHFEAKQTFCVISGLDKTLWKTAAGPSLDPGRRSVRFLVEGPVSDPRKNTAQTVRLLEGLKVSYRWVGANIDRSLIGPNCHGVEEHVPYERMPRIYGWADVLVKASNAEGMFGPPLEMFSTGGTAAVWHVQGAEEYMTDRYNSLMVPMNSWPRLAEAVVELAEDPKLVRDLQENALATARAWPTWEDQANQILGTIESLVCFGRPSLVRQLAKNQFRTIIHSPQPAIHEPHHQPVERAAVIAAERAERAAVIAAERAERAENELAQLRSSRAWRIVRLLQRVRIGLAPDGSRQWAYTLGAGRLVWRAGRRLKGLGSRAA
jgi:glycosyltransferase involved in cell wall biosynthesis